MVSAQMKPKKKKVSMRKVTIPRIHCSPYSDHVFSADPDSSVRNTDMTQACHPAEMDLMHPALRYGLY